MQQCRKQRRKRKKKDNIKPLGDPIEIALLQFINASKTNASEINAAYPLTAEEPFNSDTKVMATLHKKNASNFVAAKGAVDELINNCNFYCFR